MAIDYLISMTDFVIENENMINQTESEMSKDLFRLAQYAHFLKQKLEPWMFVPCKKVNDKWVFLEEPKNFLDYQDVYNSCEKDSNLHAWYNECQQYHDAKERVLFERLNYDASDEVFYNEEVAIFNDKILKTKSIEQLCYLKLKLTNTAKKRINP